MSEKHSRLASKYLEWNLTLTLVASISASLELIIRRKAVMEKGNILVIAREDDNPQKLVGKGPQISSLVCQKLPSNVLKANLLEFINNIAYAMDDVNTNIKNYYLDEIELKIEMTATGSIRLVGSVETGATGGITLTFKRCNNE